MVGKSLKIFLLLILCTLAFAAKARYDNYKVVEVKIDNEEQFKIVSELENVGYIIIEPPRRSDDTSRVVVPPHKFGEFDEIKEKFSLKVKTLTENLQSEIDQEVVLTKRIPNAFNVTKYNTLEEIYNWLDEMAKIYPDAVSPIRLGESYEKRPINGIVISYKTGNRAIFVEANIHAREWITAATALWLINELLTSTDPIVRDVAENIDWHFVPVANPDGYSYTHTTDRLWRKTRQPYGSLCRGVDPNRNWDFYHGGVGTSSNPCSDTYPGPTAFSEPETKAIADYVTEAASQIDAYISFHSYYQLLMYPYGVKAEGRAKNEDEIIKVCEAMIPKLAERYGTVYKFGDIATIIYEAAGASLDWVKAELDIPLPLEYELRDRGQYGFLLPPEQIEPNSREVFDSLIEMVKQARELGYLKRE